MHQMQDQIIVKHVQQEQSVEEALVTQKYVQKVHLQKNRDHLNAFHVHKEHMLHYQVQHHVQLVQKEASVQALIQLIQKNLDLQDQKYVQPEHMH